MNNELTLDRVYKASYVLNDVVRNTDLLHAPKIKPGVELYLKTENLQVTGSFKVRGAYYKIAKLSAFDGNVMEVADHLIAGGPVVLNLDAASKEAVKRIIDFFSGVAYSVKGQLKNISGNIYIVTPASVDISNDSKLFAGAKGAAKAEEAPRNSNGSPYAGF